MIATSVGALSAPTRQQGASMARWTATAVVAVLVSGISALILAAMGLLSPWSMVPVSALGTWIASRLMQWPQEPATPPLIATILLGMILLVMSLGVFAPHQHFLASRDSGTYTATAAWIAREGTLTIDAHSEILDEHPVVYESLGFPAASRSSLLSSQFLHLFPALLGAIGQLAGLQAIYWVNPVLAGLGLAVFFFFTSRLVGQRLALLATSLLGASMPFLYFSRAPFTEVLMFLFVFAGLWWGAEAARTGSPTLATAAGVLFGAALLTRIDAVVVLLGLVAYRALLEFGPASTVDEATRDSHRIVMERVVGVAGLMWLLSLLEMLLFSPQYLGDHARLIAAAMTGILVLRIAGDVAHRRGGLLRERAIPVANWTAGAMAVYLIYAATIRPLVERPHKSDVYGIAGLQRAAGLEVDPLRSYAELSLHWLSWYLGPVLVALGLLGAVLLFRRLQIRRVDDHGQFVSVAVVTTLLYVVRPSINPDHIWAMRRFLPVVIPSLIVLATWVWEAHRHHLGRGMAAVGISALLAVAVPLLITSGRGGLQPEFSGSHRDIELACRELKGSVVIILGESVEVYQTALQPVLRGWCGVPVASEDPNRPLDEATLDLLDQAAEATQGRLVVVGVTSPPLGERLVLFDRVYAYLEVTLFEAPDEMVPLPLRVNAWEWE